MSNRMIVILVVAIVAMAALSWLVSRPESPVDERVGTLVTPALEAALDDLQQVTLSSGDVTTTLVLDHGRWGVAERGGYPIDFDRFATMLNDLSEARYLERKTAVAENHALLGVAEPGSADGAAVRLEVAGTGDTPPLLLGDLTDGGDGMFARWAGEDQVWLIDGVNHVSAEPSEWLSPLILDIDAEQVSRVRHQTANGELVAIRNEETGNMELEDIPEGAELRYETVANPLGRNLVNVRLQDVRARSAEWNPAFVAAYELADGTVITVTGERDEANGGWVRFDIEKRAGEAPAGQDGGSPEATAGDAAVPAAAEGSAGDVAPSTEMEEARLEAHEYQVASVTWSGFTKSMDDMLREEEPAEMAEDE